MNIFHALETFGRKILDLVRTDAGKAKIQTVLNDVEAVLPIALEVVKVIAAKVGPNKTLEAVEAAFGETAKILGENPTLTALENFLMNVAVAEVLKQAPHLSTSTLNTAVNLAVSILKVNA